VAVSKRELALRQRWYSPEGAESGRRIARLLADGERVDPGVAGEVDGRLDLRGFEFKHPAIELAGVELRGSTSRTRRRRDCPSTAVPSVTACSTKRPVSVGGCGRPTSRERRSGQPTCEFSHANLKGINFWQSTMIRCTFAGKLEQVVFDGRLHKDESKPTPNPMEDMDFSGAEFIGGGFRFVRFDRVRLPRSPDLFVVSDAAVLDRADDRLRAMTEPPNHVAEVLSGLREDLDREHEMLVHTRDYGRLSETINALLSDSVFTD
jgi:hypothetical protein